jgi:acetyl esterase/lipase
MNDKRMVLPQWFSRLGTVWCVLALLLGCTVTLGQEPKTKAEKLQAQLFVPKANTDVGKRILKDAPKDAPDFGQFMGFLEAAVEHKIKVVDLKPAVPDDVTAKPDLVFQTIDDKKLKLDLFTPKKKTKPVPLVVLIHGGCWMAGTREEMDFYGVKLAQLGYAAASVDYRLSEVAPYPAAVDDCWAAIQWLKDHAGDYNIDPDRIALMGASAGGHLVQLLGYTANGPDSKHPKIKTVVSLYGWSDLTDPAVNYQYYMELFLGKSFADAPALYKKVSPITHVDKNSPPTLIMGGTIDTIVPITQGQKLAKKLDENNVPYIFAPFRGGYHAFDVFTNTNPGVMYFVEHFLAEHLAK